MINIKYILLISFIAGGVAACSTAPKTTRPYNPADSMALNVAKAAGIGSQLKDTEVPADTLQKFTDSAAFGVGLVGAGAIAPISGFSGLQTGAMNLVSLFFSPTPATKRNSIIVWMPHELADDKEAAVKHLSGVMLEAGRQAAAELNREVETGATKDSTGNGILFKGVEKVTGVLFGLRDPEIAIPPAFVASPGQSKSWFFNPAKTIYSSFKIADGLDFNQVEFMAKISAYLPPWVYFYAAPNQLRYSATEELNFPFIINQGKMLYFVKKKTDKTQ